MWLSVPPLNTQCLKNLVTSGGQKYLNGERSVLTLSSQVPSAYSGMCEIQLEAKNIYIVIENIIKSTNDVNIV